MNSLTQSAQIKQIQQQQTQQHNIKQLLSWVNAERSKKNLPQLNLVQQLASGNAFLEIVSIYHPKKVDLTKTFIKPKDQYEILQNYKQLLSAFVKLGWKKFDPQKFRKKKEKDLVNMTQFLKNIFNEHLFNNNQSSNVHSLLTSYQTPEKNQLLNSEKQLIKVEDKPKSRILNRSKDKKPREKSQNGKKNQTIKPRQPLRKPYVAGSHPPKPGQKPSTTLGIPPRDTPAKLPPHLYSSSKNIQISSSNLKNEQQQMNNFQNMRITKLQKEKHSLIQKILQVQQLLVRERNLNSKKSKEMKILDDVPEQKGGSQIPLQQKQNIQRIKHTIMAIIGDV